MTKEELIKDVINETLNQVFEQGWDLIDLFEGDTEEGVERVYNEIKDCY